MKTRIARLTGILGCTLLTACIGTAPGQLAPGSFAPEGSRSEIRRTGSATVIEAQDLWQRGGDLVSALRRRVSNMQVRYDGPCPRITLRGQKTMHTPSNPRVYVDGMPAMDTCVLDGMRIDDVDRVEVYPMGVTSRPGYLSHPHGLILVFTRKA